VRDAAVIATANANRKLVIENASPGLHAPGWHCGFNKVA